LPYAPLLGGEQPKVAPSVTAFGSYSKGALNLGSLKRRDHKGGIIREGS